ncbi:Glycine betaine/L-proline transport ATP-binding protein ProV [compost metagenome]|jgi:glycine betaine/L-proline transport ATP binding subunit|uniref:Quaternary amine transport ATP-binding protein n=1 Tax=Pseudomonas capeferrum TaxID=1495066 RepID=A0ABY7RFP2_9PSED|nr:MULTISPECIES: glycine betaine/L-proline ABC transporter ATP-binding protein [Pseudomonas]KEY88184.1 glycine/betaine ABC transporter ATP-binding protein [Pseudomonas capeferrum]KGI90472.1 glycine/betaine ABC transporter ATP-binding protein [Pseudomonas sp. H2]MCH7302109.1 glycine betaine/L-proline ABC transporter ATP-binding protein [Pseudomonas capeferrum]MDD2066638.1 glycine betaine/L-proline ABC transporter ATP-binding protein [Pseudomonas sp. 25571]MDD2132584.1 glycine betaine/L-proline 
MTHADEILSVKNIYKVFGPHADVAMNMVHAGASKHEVFEKTGQVIGVFDATFSVKRGEIFVIMGLSGSGKSTMVRLFNRLIEPTSGSIYLNGKEITGLSDKALLDVRRKEMGMVFQSFALMPHMSVLENTAFGLEISGISETERNKRAREALCQVGLAGHEHSYPHQLSGGMQQRVGLARALANDPTILLMDEAFSALDPLIRSEMQGELIRLQAEQKRTIIFISHDIEEAIRIGHRIAIMEGGRVVQIGTPQELINQPANDYVRTFFKGFDSSRVLKAGDVARLDPSATCRANGNLPTFAAGIDFGYLLGDHGQLLAVVDAHDDSASEAIRHHAHEQHPVYLDTPLHEVLNIAASLPYPVPVLDHHGVFRGTVSKNQLLQTLSRN